MTGDRPPHTSTVLCVEDDLLNQALVRAVLEQRAGVRLLVTGLGAEAAEIAIAERPALILLDLHLPDLSGEEVLARLRADALTEDIPVIVLTGDPATAARVLDSPGVVAHLAKPYDIHQLLALVDSVLGPTTDGGAGQTGGSGGAPA